MRLLDCIPGTQAWHIMRAKYFCASEAPSMMGVGKYQSRQELLYQKYSGDIPEVDDATQARFDRGHATENLARLILEEASHEAYNVAVGTDDTGTYLASFDGLGSAGNCGYEHKLWNAELAAAVKAGELPPAYYWQLEHQILVGGLDKVVFICSDGTKENWAQMDYYPVNGRAEQLIAGWVQFSDDLKNYQHIEVAVTPTAAPIKDLPALIVSVVGHVSASNLAEWREVVTSRIEGINTDLHDDQDFADADKMVKFLDDGERKIELVKAQAQAQATDIDALFRALDDIKASMRTKRLELSRLVEKRKTDIRAEIMQEGKQALAEYVASLDKRLGRALMPVIAADFGAVMRGKKSLSSLRGAMLDELAVAKISATAVFDCISSNQMLLNDLGKDYPALFPDFVHIVGKAKDDFTALVKSRIAEYKIAEYKIAEEKRTKQQQAVPEVASAPVINLYDKIIDKMRWMDESELDIMLQYAERIISHRQVDISNALTHIGAKS